MNTKTFTALLPIALELKDQVSAQAEAYHRSRLEAAVHGASNAEIRKTTRQERGVLHALLTTTNAQRSGHLARTRALPTSEVKRRIGAKEPSIVNQVLTWFY